jgi:hypothetical protein
MLKETKSLENRFVEQVIMACRPNCSQIICPQVSINNFPIPLKEEVKYLGLYLDKKLTWQTHIKAKRRQLELKVRNMNLLIDKKSQLSLENKINHIQCDN